MICADGHDRDIDDDCWQGCPGCAVEEMTRGWKDFAVAVVDNLTPRLEEMSRGLQVLGDAIVCVVTNHAALWSTTPAQEIALMKIFLTPAGKVIWFLISPFWWRDELAGLRWLMDAPECGCYWGDFPHACQSDEEAAEAQTA